MPTTYAHDLFGKLVYHNVNEDLKRIIRTHKSTYRIGLHGPDILFYVRPFHKNKVNQMGHHLHQEEAAEFFEKGKELFCATGDEEVLAYLLGFICHFMLDSTCHPYIAEYMKKTGASHDEIETDFDRALMERTGKNPFHYHPAVVIRPERRSVETIAEVLEGTTKKDIVRALLGMKFYTGATVCTSKLKRRILLGLAGSCGIYRLVQGRFMRTEHVACCRESTEELTNKLRKAVPETVTVMEDFYNHIYDKSVINNRFNRNYK